MNATRPKLISVNTRNVAIHAREKALKECIDALMVISFNSEGIQQFAAVDKCIAAIRKLQTPI